MDMSSFELGKTLFFMPGDATPSILQLDALIFTSTFLAILHAALVNPHRHAVVLIVGILVTAFAVDVLSVTMLKSHCHSNALVMIAHCSSLNSVCFYVPWLYTSLVAARRVFPDSWRWIPAVGVFQFLFGMCYELQGPTFGWWYYTEDDVVQGAFDEKAFGFPLMAAYFHPAFGAGFAMALSATGFISAMESEKSSTLGALFRLIFVCLLASPFALLFDIPTRITTILGVSRFFSVPVCLLLLFVLPTICSGSIGRPQQKNEGKRDHLLFFMIILWHGYFACTRWTESPIARADLMALVLAMTAGSLFLHLQVYLHGMPGKASSRSGSSGKKRKTN